MKEWYKKHVDKFSEEEALCKIHDTIERAKYSYIDGDNTEYLYELQKAWSMLGDYIQRKSETEKVDLTQGKPQQSEQQSQRQNQMQFYNPYYPYGANPRGRVYGYRRY